MKGAHAGHGQGYHRRFLHGMTLLGVHFVRTTTLVAISLVEITCPAQSQRACQPGQAIAAAACSLARHLPNKASPKTCRAPRHPWHGSHFWKTHLEDSLDAAGRQPRALEGFGHLLQELHMRFPVQFVQRQLCRNLRRNPMRANATKALYRRDRHVTAAQRAKEAFAGSIGSCRERHH